MGLNNNIDKEDKRFGLKTILFVALVSIIAGVAISARLDITNQTSAQNFWKDSGDGAIAAVSRPENFVEIAKKLSPTVVNISTTQIIKERPILPFPEFKGPFFDDFFGDEFNKFLNEPQREFKRQSLGSGFVINKEGYILTNFHVIENATEIIVTLSEHKKEYKAKVVGQDQKLDIALVKISAEEELPIAALGNSDDLQIGEWVVAIGNPFGLGGTVTAGIVSQKGRVIGAGPYDNFIQTDASINPGNSGGPLFNMKGQVVGINTAIVAGGQGIGFATPINMVKDVLLQLKERGKVTRGWIGVSVQELTPELAKSFGLKETRGVLVSSVNPGEPADQGGLKAGDVIVSFDGRPISELNDLPRLVAATPAGKLAEVRIVRDEKEKTLTIKVGSRKDEEGAEIEAKKENAGAPDKKFGLTVETLTPDVAKRLGLGDAEGVFISRVKPESPAAIAGVRRGDVIKEIDRQPVRNVKDYNRAIEAAGKKDTVRLLINRQGSNIYVVIRLKE